MFHKGAIITALTATYDCNIHFETGVFLHWDRMSRLTAGPDDADIKRNHCYMEQRNFHCAKGELAQSQNVSCQTQRKGRQERSLSGRVQLKGLFSQTCVQPPSTRYQVSFQVIDTKKFAYRLELGDDPVYQTAKTFALEEELSFTYDQRLSRTSTNHGGIKLDHYGEGTLKKSDKDCERSKGFVLVLERAHGTLFLVRAELVHTNPTRKSLTQN